MNLHLGTSWAVDAAAGASLVGIANASPQQNIAGLGEHLDNNRLPTDIVWLKHAVEDIRAFYVEALTAQPGDYDPQTIQKQFCGRLSSAQRYWSCTTSFDDPTMIDKKRSPVFLRRERLFKPLQTPKERRLMMDIQPLTETFVADICGLDVGKISPQEFNQLYDAWLKYGVLRLRNQRINEEQLQAFAPNLGRWKKPCSAACLRPTKPRLKIATSPSYLT